MHALLVCFLVQSIMRLIAYYNVLYYFGMIIDMAEKFKDSASNKCLKMFLPGYISMLLFLCVCVCVCVCVLCMCVVCVCVCVCGHN